MLDLECGQGRDAVPLARLVYSITGVDLSKTGIEQMNQIAQIEGLDLVGQVEDIYAFDRFHKFDIVLLDSMFHFAKNDREKEIGLIQRIISDLRSGSIAVICLPNTGNKVQILNQAIDFENKLLRLVEKEFTYRFEESETGHTSETDFKMIVVQK